MINALKSAIRKYPQVLPYLTGRARWIALVAWDETKTADDFAARLANLIKALYEGVIDVPSFVDSMAALISRQITLAYRNAWTDENEGTVPAYLTSAAESFIIGQFTFVDGFAREIRDAGLSGGNINALLNRVPMWAARYDQAYNDALLLIAQTNGGKLKWVYGEAEHCDTCQNLNGIVAYASEWGTLNVKPQSAPNAALDCGGWKCKCSLLPTDERKTRGAVDRIRGITGV
jgi:hypothetical protein